MALTRLGLNQSINLATNTTGDLNLASQVTGTLPTGNGGTGATSFAPGKILQIKHASTNTAASTTANSWSDSNLSCSITPISASNILLVEITQNGCNVSGSEFAGLKLRLLRSIYNKNY